MVSFFRSRFETICKSGGASDETKLEGNVCLHDQGERQYEQSTEWFEVVEGDNASRFSLKGFHLMRMIKTV